MLMNFLFCLLCGIFSAKIDIELFYFVFLMFDAFGWIEICASKLSADEFDIYWVEKQVKDPVYPPFIVTALILYTVSPKPQATHCLEPAI